MKNCISVKFLKVIASLLVLLLFSCEKEALNEEEDLSTQTLNDVNLRVFTEYSKWLTSNRNGFFNTTAKLVNSKKITGIRVREQSGYGIVNTSIIYRNERSKWTTTNGRGVIKTASFSNPNDYATGIEVSEQYGYGVIDIRLISQNGRKTPWVTNNKRGTRILSYRAPKGRIITGLQTKEQHHYGVIDVRVLLGLEGVSSPNPISNPIPNVNCKTLPNIKARNEFRWAVLHPVTTDAVADEYEWTVSGNGHVGYIDGGFVLRNRLVTKEAKVDVFMGVGNGIGYDSKTPVSSSRKGISISLRVRRGNCWSDVKKIERPCPTCR